MTLACAGEARTDIRPSARRSHGNGLFFMFAGARKVTFACAGEARTGWGNTGYGRGGYTGLPRR